MPSVEILRLDSPLLSAVKKLGGKHKRTLGFFPDGAFDDHARRKRVFVSLSESGSLAGYLAFRITKGRAIIVHLCCDDEHRGKGHARALLEELRKHARALYLSGITLHCRREYEANRIWSKAGFIPVTQKPGRGKDGGELTLWHLKLQQEDLFSGSEASDGRLVVMIDCNVFRDLHDHLEVRNEEAKHLVADWLTDQIDLTISGELYVEVNRIPRTELREALRPKLQRYRRLDCDREELDMLVTEIKQLFPDAIPTEQHESDVRHITIAIAGGAAVFVTRDEEILEQAAELESRYGLQVKRPVDLIASLDETLHAAIYQPTRLAGSEVTTQRPRPEVIHELAEAFHSPARQERRDQFVAALRAAISEADRLKVELALRNGAPIYVAAIRASDELTEFTLLRSVRSPLAMTAVRHLILLELAGLAKKGGGTLRVSDLLAGQGIQEILVELGFEVRGNVMERVTLRFLGCLAKASTLLRNSGVEAAVDDSLEASSAFEARFWPAKIIPSKIPTWTVPIRVRWAAELFDAAFASEQLFSVPARLILNRENVYYSKAVNSGICAPGRILWYVSDDSSQVGSKSYRACSRLVEVKKGSAKSLFRQFQRIGVFTWADIMDLTGGDPFAEIVALRFIDTEAFDEPVSFEEGREMGIRHSNAGPLPLDERIFEKIYRRGKRFDITD